MNLKRHETPNTRIKGNTSTLFCVLFTFRVHFFFPSPILRHTFSTNNWWLMSGYVQKETRCLFVFFIRDTHTRQIICLTIILSTNFFIVQDKKKSLFVLLQKKYYEQTKFLTHHEPMNVLFPRYVSGHIRYVPKQNETRRESEWMSIQMSNIV